MGVAASAAILAVLHYAPRTSHSAGARLRFAVRLPPHAVAFVLDELRVHLAAAGLEAADVLLGGAAAYAIPHHRALAGIAHLFLTAVRLRHARALAPDEETALSTGADPRRAGSSGREAAALSVDVRWLLAARAPPLRTVLGKRVASAFATKVEAELSFGASLQAAPGSVREALACLLPVVPALAGRTPDASAALALPDTVVPGIRPDLTNGAGGRRPAVVLDAVAGGLLPAVAALAVGHGLYSNVGHLSNTCRLRR